MKSKRKRSIGKESRMNDESNPMLQSTPEGEVESTAEDSVKRGRGAEHRATPATPAVPGESRATPATPAHKREDTPENPSIPEEDEVVVEDGVDVAFTEDELNAEDDESVARITEPLPEGVTDMPPVEVPMSVRTEMQYPDTGSDKRFFERDYVVEIVNEETEGQEDVAEGEAYTAIVNEPEHDYDAVAPEATDEREFKEG